MSPHSMAVAASMRSPVRSICIARFGPIARVSGTIGVEQNSPMRTPGVANRAPVSAMARSQLATSWQPAAVATPCTLAITGCGMRLHGGHQGRAGVEELGGVVALAGDQLGQVVAGREGGPGPGDHHHPPASPARARPAALA